MTNIIVLLFILWMPTAFSQDPRTVSRRLKFEISKWIIDLTETIDQMMAGNLTSNEFVEQLQLELPGEYPSQSKRISVTGLYATCCKVHDWCGEKMSKVVLFVNETLGEKIDIALMFSLEFDIKNQTSYDFQQQTIKVPEFNYVIMLEIPAATKCYELSSLSFNYWNEAFNPKPPNSWEYRLSSPTLIGVGYPEELLSCEKLQSAIFSATFTVVRFNFGNTPGIPESYGIFRQQMNLLHKNNLKTIKDITIFSSYKLRETYYFPNSESVGDESHRKMLLKYGTSWIGEPGSGEGMLITFPNVKPLTGIAAPSKFFVMPHFWKIRAWLLPSHMLEILQRFKMVIVTHDIWTDISDMEETKDIYSKKINNNPDFKLEVMIDFTDLQGNWSASKWRQIERKLRFQTAGYPTKNLIVQSLLFNITSICSTESYSADVDVAFAHRISQNYNVGCHFVEESFFGLFNVWNISNAIVDACQHINGSFYLLHSRISLSHQNLFNPTYYVNAVRLELEAIKQFRSLIWQHQPEATVFFRLYLQKDKAAKQNNTVFCDERVLRLNEYHEAILNWAQINQFPILSKDVFDDLGVPSDASWLSYLRPGGGPKIGYGVLPKFVMRNYPPNINNWKVDPCIHWVGGRPEVENNFFRNPFVGTIFRTEHIRNNGTVKLDALQMMFQFVFYKFQVIEVVFRSNWRNVLHAVNASFKYSNGDSKNKTIFLNFGLPTLDGNKQDWNKSFSSFMHEIHVDNLSQIYGIHMDVSKDEVTLKNGSETLVYPILLQWETFVNQRRDLNVNVGILFKCPYCIQLYKHIASGSLEINSTYLNSLQYMVCKHKLGSNEGDMKTLGHVFDTHLYIKRGFQEILPGLEIYFRVEVDILLNEDPVTMERYLQLLAHFKEFGSAYNVTYFIVEAFDQELKTETGWWAVKNYSDLENSKTYVEKETMYFGAKMWYPPYQLEPASIIKNMGFLSQPTLISIITSIFSVIVVLLGVVACYLRKRFYLSKRLTREEVISFLEGRSCVEVDARTGEIDFVRNLWYSKFDTTFELSILDLNIDTNAVIGFGNFGTVYKGVAKGRPAAVKRPNSNCSKTDFKDFLGEIKILCYLGSHPNVLGLIGAYIKEIEKGILCIATEFCENGSMESYLKGIRCKLQPNDQARNDNEGQNSQLETLWGLYDLHRFSREVAEGMEYIASKKVVHGDLSARNVFLDGSKICKIGDFGLSHKLYEYEKYVSKSKIAIPWKWMAFETLTDKEFTLKSDIWGYGVTVWEIYSLCCTPYGGLSWSPSFIDELRDGLRLTKPQYATEAIYERMQECWNIDAERRPSFGDLSEFFRSLCKDDYRAAETQPV